MNGVFGVTISPKAELSLSDEPALISMCRQKSAPSVNSTNPNSKENPMSSMLSVRKYSLQFAALLTAALVVLPQTASAAIRLWTGNVNGNFNNSGNWSGNVIPAAGDDLVFQPNNLVARLLVTNDFSPNRAFNSLTFQGSNYFLRGNPILLTNGISTVNTVGANTVDAD